jgi:arylsulfatase A-like enzyme
MTRPNLLLLSADRLRADALGCAGNPDVRTPNIDAIAAAGLRFTQVWAAATDADAARAALCGGAAAGRALAAALAGLGYETAFVGQPGAGAAPGDAGFASVALATGAGPDSYAAWLTAQGRGPVTPRALSRSFGALRSQLPEPAHVTTWIGNQAVRQVQRAREPFFLWASFNRPGQPYDPCEPWDDLYDRDRIQLPPGAVVAPGGTGLTGARLRKVVAYYYASISQVDQQVGRILATLAARGRGPTVIVFTAAAGECLGQRGHVGGVDLPLECCLRVPLVVAGAPGQARGEDDGLVQAGEIGGLLWALAHGELAGSGVAARLFGQPGAPRTHLAAEAGGGRRVVRGARWKVASDPEQWWDLKADPLEAHPLPSPPEDPEAAQLRALLARSD